MSQQDLPARAEAMLTFWFGADPQTDYPQQRKLWFGKNPAFDMDVRNRFLGDYQAAAAGALEDWKQSEKSCLALILLLDQFPRNMFRDTPQAFATDAKALSTAKHAVASRFDRALQPVERMFIYLPFEHSENLHDQKRSLALFRSLTSAPELAGVVDYAQKHFDIIARFGRFPHRNRILGRESTPEELAFLEQPGASF